MNSAGHCGSSARCGGRSAAKRSAQLLERFSQPTDRRRGFLAATRLERLQGSLVLRRSLVPCARVGRRQRRLRGWRRPRRQAAAPPAAWLAFESAGGARTSWLLRRCRQGYLTTAKLERKIKRDVETHLSVAIGDYDRNRPLIDGAVQIDGVDPVFMTLSPEEIFFRAFRSQDFDICELSLSSFDGQDRGRATAPMSACRRSCRGCSATLRSRCAPTASRSRTTSRARASACRNTSSPPTSGRARSWRTITASSRPTCTGCAAASRRRPAGEDHHQAAGGRAARRCARGQDHFAIAGRGRDRRLHRAAGAGASRADARPISAGCFADPIAAGKDYFKRTGIFPIMHLIGVRRDAGRQASLAAGGGAQGVRAIQGDMRWRSLGHLGDQGDAAVRRGALAAGARVDGRGLLVLRRRANRKTLETFLRHHHRRGCHRGW